MTKREQIETLIEENVVTCHKAKRNREILRSRFIDGCTFAEIAERFDMSEVQIGRIIHRFGDPILIAVSKMAEK